MIRPSDPPNLSLCMTFPFILTIDAEGEELPTRLLECWMRLGTAAYERIERMGLQHWHTGYRLGRLRSAFSVH